MARRVRGAARARARARPRSAARARADARVVAIQNKHLAPRPPAPCAGVPAGVTQLGGLAPDAYRRLLGEASFLLGLGLPFASPSPLEALAAGAAFLNPAVVVRGDDDAAATSAAAALRFQHDPLAALGAPYVYNVDLRNATSVLAAARRAHARRFASFVPADYSKATVVERVCRSILEDVGPCTCARRSRLRRRLALHARLLQRAAARLCRRRLCGSEPQRAPEPERRGIPARAEQRRVRLSACVADRGLNPGFTPPRCAPGATRTLGEW